jgi:exonuclease SbcC
MRPVLLEMAGFASFREPTSVDFAGAEYFALIGPTGSGKSTVIDAMTFALYGSVPRWDDRRTVGLALAPTAGRGTVRFVFDVGARRYVVARELRRAPSSGAVSVRNARLERLHDPSGTGAVEEETEPLADGAGATTAAVEELLGLPFGDFCTCVVLPQGEFAEFLHTEPRKRQEKLVRILGLGIYDVIAKAANSEAAQQRTRAELLGEQLGGYADATEAVERGAAERVAAVQALADRVGAAVPELAAAGRRLREAQARAERVRAERELLRGLTVPAGIDDLDARERAAAAGSRAATQRVVAAETADAAARRQLAAAPERGRLEQVRRDHAELAAGQAELPGLRERAEKAYAAYELAGHDAADAHEAAERARTVRDEAGGVLAAARDQLTRLVAELDGLRGLAAPPGLDELARRRAAAGAALEQADAELDAAESADTLGRAALAAAPPRAPLEHARRDLRSLTEVLAKRRAATAAREDADRALATAMTALRETRHRLEHAQARRAERQRSNLAAALRPGLTAGADCPVCAQRVRELPPPLPADAGLDEAEREVAAAERDLERARQRESAGAAAQVRAAEAVAGLADTAGRLWSELAGSISSVLDRAAVAGTSSRVAALAAAFAAVRTAASSGDTVSAGAGVLPADSGADRARSVEQLARPGGDGAGAAVRDGAPRDTDRSVPGFGGAGSGPGAVDLDQVGGPVLRALGAALDELLAELDRLAADIDAAATAVRTARARRAAAAGAAATIREDLVAAAAELRAARDPLVPFGAPAVAGDDVRAGWTVLLEWAADEAGARERAVAPARAAVDAAENALADAERTRRDAERATRDRRAAETAAARTEQEARDVVAATEGRAAKLRAALDGAPSDAEAAAALAVRADLEAAAAAAGAELRAAREQARSADGAAAAVGQELARAWQALRTARDPLVGLQAPALPDSDLRAAWSTLADWARARAEAGERELAAAEDEARAAGERRDLVESALVADLAAHDIPLTAGPGEAVAAALERARGEQRRVVERRAAAAGIAAEKDSAENAQQVAKLLGGLLRSDGFPRWLVASALDALVADASASLVELSGGQFELAHADGEFLVVDHADADARRPVKTLSGGETFQASLALALALSAQMSGLAAHGAARLESIFIDEGFGSLDDANLEIVASTLENLAVRGDRVVGLITHVPALAERVPVRFAVSRDERTSTVVRESG